MTMKLKHDLIVTIVNKGRSERIVKASKAAGAEGGTILFARGTGVRETKTLFGIPVEPEKEMVLTIVPEAISDEVLEAIVKAGDLRKPGAGIAFVLPVKSVAGICHLEPEATSPDNVICD
ncbi:P-II family nitrogen regulator [Desulfocurvibacter africanus]|uniref:Nitrogen regulatory protein P-II n=1 Tax=Desulfocurvibacter africanus subsp. africanus str. Walvis Bay TaxID=690850 RepID=F3YXR1_DESAF|nr:P-II family nitrogen regulator [Desulfocurvibacter africanus]EGJ49505.1 nitrogen regulatory protein P-II [Desulfocurvibacter africanus subsp. africanus str. Walvis Bay]